MAERKPFHESIVDTIRSVHDIDSLLLLAGLIKKTKIPKNHGAIIAAWGQKLNEFGQECDYHVPADLVEQKEEAEAEKIEEQRQEREEKAETLSFGEDNC